MTTLSGRAATLTGPGIRRQVFPAEQFDGLIDEAVAESDYERGVQRVLYDQDTWLPHPSGWYPETVLVVTFYRGWGALYYRDLDDAGQLRAVITHNPQPAPDVPELLYDAEAGATFPPNAAIPADQLRAAIKEYLETGQRPTRMRWQQPNRWLIW